MRTINAILFGCGVVGNDIIDNSSKRGVNFVSLFDVKPELIGTEICGVKVKHIDEMPAFIESNKIDIAINTATAPVSNTLDQIKFLLSKGVNVLTSLADIYVMKKHYPELYAELDAIAKANNASFFASGIQDVFWTALPVALTGCSVDIKSIKGTNVALIDFFGPGVADECYVGWDLEDFNKANESGELPVNDFLIALYEIVEKLGLHAVSESSSMKPLIASEDTYYETIDRHVKAGQLLGNYVESVIHTEEGIDLICSFASKMSEPGDSDVNKWEIEGTPTINITTDNMQGEITTGSNIVNRIPDVINAPAGVISASEIIAPYFKVADLGTYIK